MTNKDFYKIPFMRVFKIKYLPTTEKKGSRVKIIDLKRSENNEVFKVIPYDYEYSNVWEIATSYLNSIGINICCRCGGEKTDFLLTDNFDIDITGKEKN